VPFIAAEGEGSDRAVEGNGRRRWSAMMVVEAAISGGAGWLGRPKAETQWRFGGGGPNGGKG
jgi:hypothetical protein